VNGAKNKAGLMTSTVMVAKTASLWASLASCAEKKWQKTLNKLGDSYRTGKKNRAADAPVCALLTRGSKLNNRLTQRERRHLAAVKEMPCGVCGAAGPSDAHHIDQGQQFLCIPLCKDCHQGSHNGIHGRKAIWNVTKKTELSVLNDIIETLTR
jgi:hypothetical protein